MVVESVVAVVAVIVILLLSAARIVRQYERGLVFRLGRLQSGMRQPGLTLIVPLIDRLQKVNMQVVTSPVPAQEGITRDNVTVRVDAVVYFKVVEPADAIVRVEDYRFAVSQMAQTSLRSIIGKSDLDDLLSDREKLNQGLELMIDSPAVDWGVTVDRVEIKDVSLPETMKRSMARQAEAQRDRRARVIQASAEMEASQKLREAAQQMSGTPAALQLRLLQTVASVATEKNSTLVLPFPVELLRFLDSHTGQPERTEQTGPAPAAGEGGGDGGAEATAADEQLGGARDEELGAAPDVEPPETGGTSAVAETLGSPEPGLVPEAPLPGPEPVTESQPDVEPAEPGEDGGESGPSGSGR